jgi:hypothetical protein
MRNHHGNRGRASELALHTARAAATATLLRNGKVLIAAGLGPRRDVLASAELFRLSSVGPAFTVR